MVCVIVVKLGSYGLIVVNISLMLMLEYYVSRNIVVKLIGLWIYIGVIVR